LLDRRAGVADTHQVGDSLRSLRVRVTAARRYGGARYALGRALRGNWAGTYALYWRDVAAPEDSRESLQRLPAETVGRTLREDELDAYLAFRPSTDPAEPLRRIAAGHSCCAIWMRGRIVSAVWLREDVIWLPAVKRSIALERHEAYAYDSFTDPASRRCGIARRRKIAIGEHLNDRAITRLFTYVRSENTPSIRSVESYGYVPAGRLRFLRLGPASCMVRSWDDDALRGRPMDRAPDEFSSRRLRSRATSGLAR
jgi:ribosomal protein S18 acetylase RimI-like enzyme